jgi:hypothetical protein
MLPATVWRKFHVSVKISLKKITFQFDEPFKCIFLNSIADTGKFWKILGY